MLTFAASSSVVPEVRARISRFQDEILRVVEDSTATRDHAYQMNVQLCPVFRSDAPEEPAAGAPPEWDIP